MHISQSSCAWMLKGEKLLICVVYISLYYNEQSHQRHCHATCLSSIDHQVQSNYYTRAVILRLVCNIDGSQITAVVQARQTTHYFASVSICITFSCMCDNLSSVQFIYNINGMQPQLPMHLQFAGIQHLLSTKYGLSVFPFNNNNIVINN